MGTETAVAIKNPNIYDNCLVASCLKKLFTKSGLASPKPVLVVRNNIAEVKKELQLLNVGADREMSYEYLHAMELSMPGTEFRYAVIFENNVPVHFSTFQLFTLTSDNFSLEKKKGFVKGILRFFLNLKKAKVLVSGNALRNETAACCFNKAILNPTDTAELIVSVAEKIADEENASAVVLKDVPRTPHIREWLSEIGYTTPWEDSVMVLDIDGNWGNLAGYTAALSRKYKTRANKILAAGNALEVRALQEEEILQLDNDISRLFRNVADKQPFVLVHPAKSHFARLKKIYKDDFEFYGLFRQQKLVAFYSAFIRNDVYEVYYAGFDYDLNTEMQLYFNILLSALQRAISLGKTKLNLGRTSLDAKASLGAKPVEMNYSIKTVNIPNAVINWFVNYFSTLEDAKWKLRNPLK